MAKVAIVETTDIRGKTRMAEEFLTQGYAMHLLHEEGHNRTLIFFKGCYRRNGIVTTIEDVPERNRPEETLREIQDWDPDVAKLKNTVTVTFVDADAKSTMIQRFREAGFALDPIDENEHGYGQYNVFSDSWNPANSEEPVTIEDVPEQYRPKEENNPVDIEISEP